MQTQVIIADDDPRLRQEIRNLIGSSPGLIVVGEAANGREAVSLALDLDVDLVILDVVMPVMNGVDAARLIQGRKPQVKIVALSMHTRDSYQRAMQRAGASAFVIKNKLGSDLLPALEEVGRGGQYFRANARGRH